MKRPGQALQLRIKRHGERASLVTASCTSLDGEEGMELLALFPERVALVDADELDRLQGIAAASE